MTAIKNGIKCTLRTPWKTILFSMVLILLSTLLAVSLCVFSAVRGYLRECDEYYHTIADLEYIGCDYPNESVCDPAMQEAVETHRDALNALLQADGVLSFEPQSNAVAKVANMSRWDKYMIEADKAVIRVFTVVYDGHLNCYMGIGADTLYGRRSYTDKVIKIVPESALLEEENRLDKSKSYYTVGDYFNGNTPHPWIHALPTSFTDAQGTVTLPSMLEKGSNEAMEQAYFRYAELLDTINNVCRVEYTASMEDLLPFHQQILSISKGRMFTKAEYQSRAHVCVVSERIAGLLELGVGDTIDLTVYLAGTDYAVPAQWTQTDAGSYEIVGLYPDNDDYPYLIYLPDANAVKTEIASVIGYGLGQVRLENSSAEAFFNQAHPLTEYGFRVTIYDQGYAAATEPMRELMFISIVFLAVCLLLAIVAHVLQSYLFVTRQRDTALTMVALGSGRGHVIVFFVSAALLLAIVSAVIGCAIGKLLEGRVMEVLRQFAMQFAERDLRFSDSRLSFSRTLAFEPSIPLRVYLLSAVTLTLGSALFTVLITARSLKEKHKKKRRSMLQRAPKRLGKSSNLSGVLKFAILSMRRGVVRTISIILLCLMAAVFFGRLTTSLDGYRQQLDVYRSNAVITGLATDSRGQKIDGLLVKQFVAKKLLNTELIADYTVTHEIAHCEVITSAADPNDLPEADMKGHDLPTYGSFAFDPYDLRLFYAAKWIATTSVGESPMFHYTQEKDIVWADGYSDEDFTGEAEICALPQSMMDECGIHLGDTVRFLYMESESKGVPVLGRADVKVVGAYAASLATPVVYSPFGYDPALARNGYLNQYGVRVTARRTSYGSFLFTLQDTADLDALRNALDDAGFTYVHSGVRLKPYAIIEDEMYLNTTQSMERQIQYVGVLYDALYIIAGVIGLVLAWLLTLSRRQEIAVMRAMGTQPYRILLNFLFEQAVLSALGVVAGCAIAVLTGCTLTPLMLILCGAFWGIWNLSTLVCLIVGLLKPSYASLTEPE